MAKNLYISALLDVYGKFLSKKQRILTEYYYNEDLSLSEIAENEGITRQGVLDNIKRAESKLLMWEDECGYCKSFLELKELSEKINGNYGYISDIKKIIENL